jgi:hypothetical protein
VLAISLFSSVAGEIGPPDPRITFHRASFAFVSASILFLPAMILEYPHAATSEFYLIGSNLLWITRRGGEGAADDRLNTNRS